MSVTWTSDDMVEIVLNEPDDFLKVKETLTRIGISSRNEDKVLSQTCHILHKRGKYYILHFKELFCLDNKKNELDVEDIERRNVIVQLLLDWGLIADVIDPKRIASQSDLRDLKIISFKDKNDWNLVEKYNIGIRK